MREHRPVTLLNTAPLTCLFLGGCIAYHLFLWITTRRYLDANPEAGPAGGLMGIHFDVLRQYGASYREGVWDGGWQRFVLPMFMHGDLLHIGFNMWFLYQLGPALEVHFGTSNFGTIYLLSGVGGTCLSLILGGVTAVGASGAIFGLLGASLAIRVFACDRWRRAYRNAQVKAAVTYIGLLFLVCMLIPHVDNWGHLGGLLFGVLFGGLFEYWRKNRRVRFAALFVCLALLGGLVAVSRWMVFNPHYHVHLGLRADEQGRAAEARRQFDEARRWSRLWRSRSAGWELAEAIQRAVEQGETERAARYWALRREVARADAPRRSAPSTVAGWPSRAAGPKKRAAGDVFQRAAFFSGPSR